MKTNSIKAAVMAVFAAITLTIAACAPQAQFTQADLTGNWTILLLGNASTGRDYSLIKVAIDDRGRASCLSINDSSGTSSCDGVTLPTLLISPDGFVTNLNVPQTGISVSGTMYFDKESVYLTTAATNGVALSGTMTRTSENFSQADLTGQWTISMYGNGSPDYDWTWLQLDIDYAGSRTCLSFSSSNPDLTCEDVVSLTVPQLFLSPNGLVYSTADELYGLMDFDGTNVYLANIPANEGVTRTGIMTKLTEDFEQSELTGEWTIMITENGNAGTGWKYLEIDVDDIGKTSCLLYIDSYGNSSCDGISTPYIALQPDGSILTSDNSYDGMMSFNRNTGFIANIGANGVTATGVMTRR